MKMRILLAFLCVLTLSGCVNRAQADAKLARACKAAVEVFLDDTQRIDKIKDSTFSGSPVGPDFRHVKIHTIMVDGWLETNYDYECIFQEGFGFLNSGYTAAIEQVRVDDRTIGRAGGDILGNADDFIKMTDAVREALYESE